MSKSEPSEFACIYMTDTAEAIRDKIKRATTDPHLLPESVSGLKGRAEAANLLNIYAALTDRTLEEVVGETAGQQFSQFKPTLADTAVAVLVPINTEMKRLLADPGEIDRILKRGADKARDMAAPVLREVYNAVGFLDNILI